MQKSKQIASIIFIVVTVFFSYFILNVSSSEHILLEKYNYNINVDNIKNNSPAQFRGNGKSRFFIHPGNKKPIKCTFIFNNNNLLKLKFYLAKGAKNGNIKFTINKNSNHYNTFQIDSKNNMLKNIYLYAPKGAKIEIIADKNGDTTYDWGNIFIEKITFFSILRSVLIPVLWITILLFLWYYGFIIIGILSYFIFLFTIYVDYLSYGLLNVSLLSSYTIFYFALTFVYIVIIRVFKKYNLSIFINTIITILVLTVPLINIIYLSIFDTKVTQDVLYAIFQTNFTESIEFVKSFVSVKYILALLIGTFFIIAIFYIQNKYLKYSLEKKIILLLFIIFIGLSCIHFKELRLLNMLQNSYTQYIKEVELFNQEKEKRKISNISFKATKKNQHETYIVVIGESLNKHHMSLYGYPRDTTPILNKMYKENKLIKFDNAYSNHTVTTYTLSLALTTANQYNKQKYYNSISIVEILKKADVETYWVTAQPIHGAFQNLITTIATEVDHFMPMDIYDAQQGLDGSLIKKIDKILKTPTNKNRVIFVHLMGSHYSYSKRYPNNSYSLFKGSLSLNGITYNEDRINTYDNSIAYNDYVVSTILKSLQKYNNVSGFIYMSDHSEDVLEGKSHNPTQFTFSMTQIPMIAWFSQEFKKLYPNKYNTLVENSKKLFSNDLFYDTLIGIMDIKTNMYEEIHDLSSKKYLLKDEEALTLHGTKKYIDKSNSFYWNSIKN